MAAMTEAEREDTISVDSDIKRRGDVVVTKIANKNLLINKGDLLVGAGAFQSFSGTFSGTTETTNVANVTHLGTDNIVDGAPLVVNSASPCGLSYGFLDGTIVPKAQLALQANEAQLSYLNNSSGVAKRETGTYWNNAQTAKTVIDLGSLPSLFWENSTELRSGVCMLGWSYSYTYNKVLRVEGGSFPIYIQETDHSVPVQYDWDFYYSAGSYGDRYAATFWVDTIIDSTTSLITAAHLKVLPAKGFVSGDAVYYSMFGSF